MSDSSPSQPAAEWSIDEAKRTYHIDRWGLGYYDIDAEGQVVAQPVVEDFGDRSLVPEEIRQLDENLSDQYLCNFSVFQSLIDHWALKQVFPVMLLQALGQAPEREAQLVDITCDSDGKVDQFISPEAKRDTLSLHLPASAGPGPYLLGFFLMVAYQDIMGDMHNLFGRVNKVHVFLDPEEESGYYIEEVIEGTSIASVLDMVQYDKKALVRSIKKQIDHAIRDDRVKPSEGMRLLADCTNGLRDQTYLSL